MTRLLVLQVTFIVFCLMSCSSNKIVQQNPLTTYDISELDTLIDKGDRPIVIFMHAPWCTFCRNMEHTTLKNEPVKELLSSEFYFISFDGEDKRVLEYNDDTYEYRPHSHTSGTNELGKYLGAIEDQLVYPTLVIMSPTHEIIGRYGTFLSSNELLAVLRPITVQ